MNKPSEHKRYTANGHLPLLYPETIAFSILLYAAHNEQFRQDLKTLLGDSGERRNDNTTLPRIQDASILLLYPCDNAQAQRRAEWLIQTQNARALSILESVYNEPKNIVFGIIGLAIIGPTLGLIKKRRIRNEMPVIISREGKMSAHKQGTAVAQTSLTLLERELERARHHLKKLEPDTYDWFTGDKAFAFYAAPPQGIAHLTETLSRLDIAYALKSAGGRQVLAISPSVSLPFLESQWGLESY